MDSKPTSGDPVYAASGDSALERTRRLRSFGDSLATATEPQQITAALLKTMLDALSGRAGFIWLLEEVAGPGNTAQVLRLSSHHSDMTPDRLPELGTISLGSRSPLCDAIAERRAIFSGDPESPSDGRPDPVAALADPHGAPAILPMLFGPRAVGVLWLSFDAARCLGADERELLGAFTTEAVAALARFLPSERLRLAVDVQTADRRNDEFLAILGHELRNPLAPIVTALALMERRAPELQKNERAVIRRQVEHLTRLVDDLLDVSRITRGKVQLSRRIVELSSVLARAIEIASPLLEKRRHPLIVDVAPKGLPVDADATRLAQVFQNLLTNAAKYSDRGKEIRVAARCDGDEIVVDVTDNGIGIGPDLLPRLFQRFVQGERALDRAEGGLGLGLTIVENLLELHGGRISAHSEGVGHGSTFTVTLPRAPEASLSEPTALLPQRVGSAVRRRILIVDDNVDAAQMLGDLVRDLGHEPKLAHDALSALDLIASFEPSIALLDIGLPVMDGYELAQRLRAVFAPNALRLIAVTGYGQESDRLRAKQAGFDHHLIKPLDVDELIPLLEIN